MSVKTARRDLGDRGEFQSTRRHDGMSAILAGGVAGGQDDHVKQVSVIDCRRERSFMVV